MIWVTSDLHIGHKNIVRGGKIAIRPFDNVQHMHVELIQRWNAVVAEADKVYILGDITLDRPKKNDSRAGEEAAEVVRALNGKKRLIMGNHDLFPAEWYLDVARFEKVMACRKFGEVIFTHIPIHPSQFARFKGNVHGHLHEAKVKDHIGRLDTRYVNVCLEQTNYAPVSLDWAVSQIIH